MIENIITFLERYILLINQVSETPTTGLWFKITFYSSLVIGGLLKYFLKFENASLKNDIKKVCDSKNFREK